MKKLKCLVFNGWLFESYDDAKSAYFRYYFLDEIANKKECLQSKKHLKRFYMIAFDKFKLVRKGIKMGADFTAYRRFRNSC